MNTHHIQVIILLVVAIIVGIISAGVISQPEPESTGIIQQEVQQLRAGTDIKTTVASHNSREDCWTIIDGSVYDVTTYIPLHPGGVNNILRACGVDATEMFTTNKGGHRHSDFAHQLLENMKISINTTNKTIQDTSTPMNNADATTQTTTSTQTSDPTTASITLSSNEVATHNIREDCWLIIDGSVYDVTTYIPLHPGGQQRILNACGSDATALFTTNAGGHTHSSTAHNLLNNFFVGELGSTTEVNTSAPSVPANVYTGSYDDDDDDEWEEDD